MVEPGATSSQPALGAAVPGARRYGARVASGSHSAASGRVPAAAPNAIFRPEIVNRHAPDFARKWVENMVNIVI
jgi:hypothetical protein